MPDEAPLRYPVTAKLTAALAGAPAPDMRHEYRKTPVLGRGLAGPARDIIKVQPGPG